MKELLPWILIAEALAVGLITVSWPALHLASVNSADFMSHLGVVDFCSVACCCLQFADILLTDALLAGGGDPIHKLMDAFWKFTEAASAKASGTTTK